MRPKNQLALAILAVAAVALLSGCTVTKITTPSGASFTSHRFADFTRIGKLEANINGEIVSLEGYDSDRQTAAVKAMEVAQEALKLVPAAP